jgi:hypothetical protein
MPPEHYPPGWKQFSIDIRYVRAKQRCECTGQCGLHQGRPVTRRCIEQNHQPAHFANGRVTLTVAHLCTCDPICLIPAHVIAACQRCHLRIDRFKHAHNRIAHQKTHQQATPAPGEAAT